MQIKKIGYIINHTTFFSSHILPHAVAALKKGYRIKLFCGNYSSESMNQEGLDLIRKNKIDVQFFNFNSSSINLITELFAFLKLFINVKKFNPDLLHVATVKGQIYGGLIARFLKTDGLIIFISGMGYLFTNKLNFYEKFFFKVFNYFQKFVFDHKNKLVIVENNDDYIYLKKKYNLNPNSISIIHGSGVDLKKYKKIKKLKKNKIILFVGRVLKEKGICEFIKSALNLKKKYPKWRFVVAGATDYKKSSNISFQLLEKYKNSSSIEFLGHKKNIYSLYKKTAIVCLPSYREGLPKSLCEAAACGLPVVTTNVIGCKSAVIKKKTAELCKPKSVNSLQKKIELLINSHRLRSKYGKNGLILAKKRFDIKIITNQILFIYKNLFNEKK